MGWSANRGDYQTFARSIDPSVVITEKRGWFWWFLGLCLTVVTCGRIRVSGFMENYATTIGPIQAYPVEWPRLDYGLIAHEARHTRQCRWCGLGISPWLGLLLYAILYLLLPLPLGLAYGRFYFELDADRSRWRWQLDQGVDPAIIRARALAFGATISGAAYGWSWPRTWVVRAFLQAAETEISRGRR